MSPPRRQREAAFQGEVIDFARLHGWRHYHTHDSRRSNPGFPDLVLVRGEKLLFAELKAAKGVCSQAQVDWLLALDAVPGIGVAIWRPQNWDRIERALGAPITSTTTTSFKRSSLRGVLL